jgi:cell wall assembly regulator SMI1
MDEYGPATVRAIWERVVAWCRADAPVTAAALHRAVDDVTLAAAQQETGQAWPDDLVAVLKVSDGADRAIAAAVIPPCFIPSPVARIQADWHLMTGISRDIGDPDELAVMVASEAGSSSPYFLRSWIPIADDTAGNLLFVDLRPGELQGSVSCWWRDDGFHQQPTWSGVARMAGEIADALEDGLWVPDDTGERDLKPVVHDGVLGWEDADSWETLHWD